MLRNGSATSLQLDISPLATLTSGQLSMFAQETSAVTRNAISSPASVGGHALSGSLGGQTIVPSGPAPAPANLSAVPTNMPVAKPMSGTSGPIFTVSPMSAFLQSSLENKLREMVDLDGSPEFALTWKHQDIPSQPRIFRLAASARHRSEGGSGLWPWASPKASDGEKASNLSHARKAAGRTADNLPGQMREHWGLTVEQGAPCPEHPLWLMGYPPAVLNCAPSETLSSHKSRRGS